MIKSEVVEIIANECDISKAKAKHVLDVFEATVIKTLKAGGSVELLNFIKIKPFKTKARMGKDPRTGTPLKIKARHTAKFQMGRGFKESLN